MTTSRSDAIGELATALARAQSQMAPAVRGSTNPHFKSKYADLADVWSAARGPLGANGLSVSQLPADGPDGRVSLTTLLMHTSGQWLETTATLPAGKTDAQALGSALSYLRRYMLAAVVGIATDDDDGQAAAGRASAGRAKRDPALPPHVSPFLGAGEYADEAADDMTPFGAFAERLAELSALPLSSYESACRVRADLGSKSQPSALTAGIQAARESGALLPQEHQELSKRWQRADRAVTFALKKFAPGVEDTFHDDPDHGPVRKEK